VGRALEGAEEGIEDTWNKMRQRFPQKMIRLVPGLAIPQYMGFILKLREPIKYTRKAIEAGHLLRMDYYPPYIELRYKDVEGLSRRLSR